MRMKKEFSAHTSGMATGTQPFPNSVFKLVSLFADIAIIHVAETAEIAIVFQRHDDLTFS